MSESIELWKAAIALVGVVVAAIIPYIAAYRTAKRAGLTNTTLEEIKDRARFRESQQKAVREANEMAFAALEQVRKLSEQNMERLGERDLLFADNTRKARQIIILEGQVKNAEERISQLEAQVLALHAHYKASSEDGAPP